MSLTDLVASLFLVGLTAGCDSSPAGSDSDATTGSETTGTGSTGTGSTIPPLQLGFNAKGSFDTANQVAAAAGMLDDLPTKLRDRMQIRVTGGTLSQTQVSADWSDAQLDAWTGLQHDYGIGLIYVVDGNDTPANQAAFVQRWIDHGAHFSFLEMMNEYYLPKFRNGDTTEPDVTRVVTPEIYVDDILPTYAAALTEFELPLFIIGAPSRNATLAAWNDAIVQVPAAHPEWHVGVTIHLYDDGSAPFDYDQIPKLRARLPAGTPLAITEAGIVDPAVTTYEQAATRSVAHESAIIEQLTDGDYLLDQVLYAESPGNVISALHLTTGGLTPKGAAIVQMFEATN